MALSPFSTYGRFAKTMPGGIGESFYVVPSTSTLVSAVQSLFQPDEDGVIRAYTDIQSALNACVSGRGDYVYLMPGTYTISTALTLTSIHDVHIVGMGTPGQAILTGSAANVLTLVTCNGWEITNCQFNLASTKMVMSLNGCSNFDIHHNVFLSAVGGAASHFINMNTAVCNYNRIHDNQFISNLVVAGGNITQTSHITGLGIGNVIEHNEFVSGRVTTANAGVVTTGILFNHAADAGNLIRSNSFTEFNGATFTAGVDYGTTAVGGSAIAYFNNFMLGTAANAIVNGSNAGEFANNIASGTV